MTTPIANVYNDFSGLAKLRVSAHQDGQAALREVAQQFEAIFTQMLLKSMRAASLGDGIFDSGQSKAYQDMFDQQMSVTMAAGGKGMGIADMLMRQLGAASAQRSDVLSMPASTGVAARGASALPSAAELAVRRAMTNGSTADGSITTGVPVVGESLPRELMAFVQRIAPHAKAAADNLGVSLRAVLSQVALETGWGQHVPSRPDGQSSFNLFGIKAGASWEGDRVTQSTLEVENGAAKRQDAEFRAYDSPADAFADYAHLLGSSPRYAAVSGHGDDVGAFGRALQHAGYATDPGYAAKLSAIASSASMRGVLAALARGIGAQPEAPTETIASATSADGGSAGNAAAGSYSSALRAAP